MSAFKKTVLLTGGSGKFGKILLTNLAKEGYKVLFTSRSDDKISAILNDLKDFKFSIEGIKVDLTFPNYLKEIETHLIRTNATVNYLINNARNLDYLGPDNQGFISAKNWEGEFKLGIVVPYELINFLALNEQHDLKRVINIASIYGVVAPNLSIYNSPLESPVNYGVIKAALIHLSKEMAVRYASKNLSINTISYGGVEGRASEEFKAKYANLCPQKKMLKENEISGPVKFLLSNESSGITGHNLIVDGGWTIW